MQCEGRWRWGSLSGHGEGHQGLRELGIKLNDMVQFTSVSNTFIKGDFKNKVPLSFIFQKKTSLHALALPGEVRYLIFPVHIR